MIEISGTGNGRRKGVPLILKSLRSAFCLALTVSLVFAQRGGNDWMTAGFDAQRSHWVRSDNKINPASMTASDFKLVWKYELKSPSTPPALLDFYIGYRGFRTLGFLGSQNNKVTAIDTDMPREEWQKDYGASAAPGSANCPGGMTSNVTRPTVLAYAMNTGGRGGGRGTPAKSGVGEPLQGAVTIRKNAPPPPPPPKPTPAAAAAAAAANPFAPRVQYLNSLSADGKFHSVWISNGNEPNAAIPFLPAGANARGLIVINGHAYASTSHACGGAANGVHVLDIANQKVSSWKASGEGVAGSAGPAFGPDGTLYVATLSGDLVALEEKTLREKDRYSNPASAFRSSPVVFAHKGKDYVAAVNNEGQLQVFDAASLKTPLAESRPSGQPGFNAGALASWQDPAGVRWILVPTARVLMAYKLNDETGTLRLERAWASSAMTHPLTPVIVNGVIFAAAAGDANSPAKLFALDALTGKEFWNSGATIKSHVTTGGLAAGGSRIYLSTADGMLYVFGMPLEI
jgi:outer membrane protein assembly factor BamB